MTSAAAPVSARSVAAVPLSACGQTYLSIAAARLQRQAFRNSRRHSANAPLQEVAPQLAKRAKISERSVSALEAADKPHASLIDEWSPARWFPMLRTSQRR
jgi:hypothetical protein